MTDAGRDTIFALSSGAPPAAIAIVRVSGPAAAAAAERLAGAVPPPRLATYTALRDGDVLLDRGLLLWFPAPASATGEDLAEFHLHGGRAVVAAVLAALGRIAGCRPAQAGEFTRRAFTNGRIDLFQAEGLADLLEAETEGARRRALRSAEGGLGRQVAAWRARLLELAARAEAVLEFGADDPDIPADRDLAGDIGALAAALAATLADPPAERLRDGVRIVVAGPPNAGKSTLVNALAGREVALATAVAGTTRDLVEAPVRLGDLALVLVDTAGLRRARGAVERLGVARAERALAEADLVLWLGAAEVLPPTTARVLVVHARSDLPGRERSTAGADLRVSAATGAGLGALRARLAAEARALLPPVDLAWTAAHRGWIAQAHAALIRVGAAGEEVIVAEELAAALAALEGLAGRRDVDAMLDRLFARFCVGK